MKIFVNQKHFSACFVMMFLACLLVCGCREHGPKLPLDSIDESFSDELRGVIPELYQRDPESVLNAIEQLKKMGEKASSATPYLVSMLTDKRIAKVPVYGFVKSVPVFKAAAAALGSIGEDGFLALVDSLEKTARPEGIDDDFVREAVAEGLRTAKKKWGKQPFQKISGTGRVDHIIEAATACLALQSSPGRFDKSDPRKSLKFYQHFSAVSTREGLEIFIEALGDTGDERALTLLTRIVPLSKKSLTGVKVDRYCRVQRASSIAQYKIKPLAVDEINPVIAEVLLIEFIKRGDLARVGKMLEEGMSPDTKTITAEPAISLAFKKQHIDIFHRLVKSGASIDFAFPKNETLLIRAAAGGDYEFVKLLLENGADPLLITHEKETAYIACFNELIDFWDGKSTGDKAEPYLKIIRLLRKAGSPPLPEKLLRPLDKKALQILEL